MTKVYCYDRCTTCKKALAWLEAKGVDYKKIDIKGEHPDEKTLRALHKKTLRENGAFFDLVFQRILPGSGIQSSDTSGMPR